MTALALQAVLVVSARGEFRAGGNASPVESASHLRVDLSVDWDSILQEDEDPVPPGFETQQVQYPFENDVYEGRDPDGQPFGQRFDDHPDNAMDLGEPGAASIEDCVSAPKPFLKWSSNRFTMDVIPRSGDGIGFTNVEYRGSLRFPRAPFVWISSRFAWHFLNGPQTAPDDVPTNLYDASLDATIAWRSRDEKWMAMLAIAPGIFSDFENTNDAFRLTGRLLAMYQWRPETQLIFGAVYLGRDDLPWVPAVGVMYVPYEWLRYEISLPRPRIAYRYAAEGDVERWVYTAGELGGGTWSARRAGGADDVLSYRDFQWLIGIERKQKEGLSWQVEAGWLFGRKLEWESGVGDRDIDPAGIVRVMLTY
jgi:hypothetical protein